jgi:short-subunit dehydrogenase
MNQWALITGASAGIGSELAKLFAGDKFNLVLVARNEARLNQLAAELRSQNGIEAKVVAKDLSSATAPQEIFDAVRDTPVSILVNNAGSGWHGAFAETELQRALDIMHLNMDALVRLTHLFVQPMLARCAGKILNVASTAAFQPGPLISIYYASKAFVYSFSYALAEELKETGVTVTTLCPGTTQTEFFERGNFGPVRASFTMDARTVAEAGYRGLMRGKRVVIPGMTNKITSALAKRLPVALTTAIVRRIHEGVEAK